MAVRDQTRTFDPGGLTLGPHIRFQPGRAAGPNRLAIDEHANSIHGGKIMNRLTIGHVGLHVRNIEEEVDFMKIIGAEPTGVGKFPNGRLGYRATQVTTRRRQGGDRYVGP